MQMKKKIFLASFVSMGTGEQSLCLVIVSCILVSPGSSTGQVLSRYLLTENVKYLSST